MANPLLKYLKRLDVKLTEVHEMLTAIHAAGFDDFEAPDEDGFDDDFEAPDDDDDEDDEGELDPGELPRRKAKLRFHKEGDGYAATDSTGRRWHIYRATPSGSRWGMTVDAGNGPRVVGEYKTYADAKRKAAKVTGQPLP